MCINVCGRVVSGFRVGQSVQVAGRVGVQILGDARGVHGRLRGAQGGRAVGRRAADGERDGVRSHGGQQSVAGLRTRRRAGLAGGHVHRPGRPQRRVRDTVSPLGAAVCACRTGGRRAGRARAASAGAAVGRWHLGR